MAKVLVIDDEQQIRDVMRKFLERAGHEVVCIEDGIDAKKAIRQDRPDLIISDVIMPKLDGSALIYNLKSDAEFQKIPVILVSALGENKRYLGEDVGAEYYMSKPFDWPRLLERVEELVNTTQVKILPPQHAEAASRAVDTERLRKEKTAFIGLFSLAAIALAGLFYLLNTFRLEQSGVSSNQGVSLNMNVLSDSLFVLITPLGLAFLVYQTVMLTQIFKKQPRAQR